MRVVDTSAWIEWLIGGPLHKTLRKEFPEKAQCVVPTIVQLELAKWLVREAGEDQADHAIAFTQKFVASPTEYLQAIRVHIASRRAEWTPEFLDAVESWRKAAHQAD